MVDCMYSSMHFLSVSFCVRLFPSDGHDHCLECLGLTHAKTAFVDGSCPSCENMAMLSFSRE